MKALGIDLSLTSTGLAIVEDNDLEELKIIKTTTVPTKASEDWEKRRQRIKDKVVKWAEDIPIIGLENYSFGSRYNREIAGEIGGICRLSLYENHGVDNPILVAPTQAKKFVTGKGNAKKEKVKERLEKFYGTEFETDDESDAVAIALVAHAVGLLTRGDIKLDSLVGHQREVVEKIME